MLYSGTIGMPFNEAQISSGINMDKVRNLYFKLANTNAYISAYLATEIADAFLRSHQQQANIIYDEDDENTVTNTDWPSYIMPAHDVFPSASLVDIFSMTVGTDLNNFDVHYSTRGLLSIMFPYLYTTGTGHYNLSSDVDTSASNNIGTLKQYVKALLESKDRRFAQDPNWVFFIFDLLERLNIQSANRRVVSANRRLTRANVFTEDFDNNNTSFVPYVIRSSTSYKKMHALDLHTVFNKLGAPQLFLTFSCNDFSPVYRNACEGLNPWVDVSMFAKTFKNRWLQFFNLVIKGVSLYFSIYSFFSEFSLSTNLN